MKAAADGMHDPFSEPAAALRSREMVLSFPRLQRSVGQARVAFKRRGAATALDDLHQSGCCKVRFPRPDPGASPEAVLINTAGGLTDADRLTVEATWRPGACAAVTSQAAERVYRSRGEPARVVNRVRVGAGATGLWAPQETILFDGGRMVRCLSADVAEGGHFVATESVVFGRRAMGETVRQGRLRESWRLRYAGRLVFADSLNLEGDVEMRLARPGIANRAVAVASVIYAGPHAARLLEPVRVTTVKLESVAGCSNIGPVLNIRVLSKTGIAMRRDLKNLLDLLTGLLGRDGAAPRLPRAWSC